MTPSLPFWYRSAYDLLLDVMPEGRPLRWVECGVYEGAGIVHLLKEAARRDLNLSVYAIDTFIGVGGGNRPDPELRDRFLRNVGPAQHGSLRLCEYDTIEAAELIEDGSCDVVWLDSDHRYKHVLAEITAWWPKVKRGGWIGGDDWAFSQVGDPDGPLGVQKAVMAFFDDSQILVGHGVRDGAAWPWWLVHKPLETR